MDVLPPVEIKLRRKYIRHVHGTYRSTHNMQGTKKRKKIGYDRHVALYGLPKFINVLVLTKSGKRSWVREPVVEVVTHA